MSLDTISPLPLGSHKVKKFKSLQTNLVAFSPMVTKGGKIAGWVDRSIQVIFCTGWDDQKHIFMQIFSSNEYIVSNMITKNI